MMAPISLRVRTYSGFRADERPLSFFVGEREFPVTEVLDRWHGPDHAYFKLRAEDGNTYLLRHRLETDEWEMIMMEAGETPDGEASP